MCSVTAPHVKIPCSIPSTHTIFETSGLVAWLKGQSNWDGAGKPVSKTWLSLKWLAAAMVLGAEWNWVCEIPLVLTTWYCSIAHCAMSNDQMVQGTGSY